MVGLQGSRTRPLILVHKWDAEPRRRFTLAHELGHILLPWHLGANFACDTSDRRVDQWATGTSEPEANRFAAELLVPSAWLDDRIAARGDDSVADLVSEILKARVSIWVAAFRLSERLPRGHVFALVNADMTVVLSGETPGTGIGAPRAGDVLDRARLDRFASNRETIPLGSREMIWWTFRSGPGELQVPAGDSTALLMKLAAHHAPAGRPIEELLRSCNGILGYAADQARRAEEDSAAQLYAAFRERFAKSRNLPPTLIADPEFDVWLRLRATELGSS